MSTRIDPDYLCAGRRIPDFMLAFCASTIPRRFDIMPDAKLCLMPNSPAPPIGGQ
jgi:hypothetical protein